MLKTPCLVLLATLLAAPAFSKDVTYVCRLNVPTSQQWVPSQIAIFHKDGATEALVNDPLISYFLKQPAVAKVAANNEARITFTWELPHVRNADGQETPRFLYRASYYKKSGKVSIAASPAGYANNFNAYGSCRLK